MTRLELRDLAFSMGYAIHRLPGQKQHDDNQELKEQFLAMRKQGVSLVRIASTLRIDRNTLSKWNRELCGGMVVRRRKIKQPRKARKIRIPGKCVICGSEFLIEHKTHGGVNRFCSRECRAITQIKRLDTNASVT